MKYLGEKAKGISTPDGKMGALSASIGRFVLDRSLIGSEQLLKPGSTKIHSVKCYATRRAHESLRLKGRCSCWACRSHKPCSTLKAEGFIHKEEGEQLLRKIFARIKGEKEETKKVEAEIIRGQNKIKNPKEKFEVKKEDTIETNKGTQVTIADGFGNKISIGGGSKVKINEPSNLELLVGTVTTIIKSLRPKTKFEIHTPTCTTSRRGTIFSLWTDGETTSLTVVEGEVEFSDLKGNKVIVEGNQTCICSKGQGPQNPVTLPINLKEQFKGA